MTGICGLSGRGLDFGVVVVEVDTGVSACESSAANDFTVDDAVPIFRIDGDGVNIGVVFSAVAGVVDFVVVVVIVVADSDILNVVGTVVVDGVGVANVVVVSSLADGG